jgi:uncharacterized protein (TIGR02246 family)
MRGLFASTALSLGLALSPAIAQTTPTSDAAVAPKIEQLIADYVQTYNRRDAAALAAFYAADGVFVSVTGMPIEGRDAIEKFWAAAFTRMGNVTQSAKASEIHALGEGAWGIGEYSARRAGQAGPPEIRGHWSAVYVPEGGAWKIRMLSGAPNVQPPPPPPTAGNPKK